MSVLQIAADINISPRIVRLLVNDSNDVLTAPGYLNIVSLQGFVLFPTDMMLINYGINNLPGLFYPIIESNTITLLPYVQNIFYFDVTCTAEQLNNNNSVILVKGYPNQQFLLRNMFVNDSPLFFSGGGGDRGGQVTDGTTIYSNITPFWMKEIVNGSYGTSQLPFPQGNPINTATQPGSSLYFSYFGGTTDYSIGQINLTGEVKRII